MSEHDGATEDARSSAEGTQTPSGGPRFGLHRVLREASPRRQMEAPLHRRYRGEPCRSSPGTVFQSAGVEPRGVPGDRSQRPVGMLSEAGALGGL